ncbi:MAG: hypothetical protein M1819_004569 [Sarea resinae]|nr:MAG: hypothetical protein M1819_004569 [Sarea resinae]
MRRFLTLSEPSARAFTTTSRRAASSIADVTPTAPHPPHPNIKQAETLTRGGPSLTSAGDFDTSYSVGVRKYLRVHGLTPPAVETYETQAARCLKQIRTKTTNLGRYTYLSHIRNSNPHLFYRLAIDHLKEVTPLVYTPVVGEACLKWSEIYRDPEGLYISYSDRGNIYSVLQNWPAEHPEISVVTDGSRILGLGDLGINGMGIPVGKLALYTACAGIRPGSTLPIMLDLGTNNPKLLKDPLYMGARRERVSAQEEMEFMDELMAALTEKWPGIVIQFEDFKDPFPPLKRYRNTYTCFNDDIQGTGAVILAGAINAIRRSGVSVKDHRVVFVGAGSAAVGVGREIAKFFVKTGLTEEEARQSLWYMDVKGLVTKDRGDEYERHLARFARDDNEGKQYSTVAEVVDHVKPTMLVGLSTVGGIFDKHILSRMGEFNERPIIFPLSNPSSQSECTFEEALKYTGGRAIFASGSPYDSIEYDGQMVYPGQGNNMYVFPGIGLGTILCKAASISDEMTYAAGDALSTALTQQEIDDGKLYPDVERIREVSVTVARGVIRAAQKQHLDRQLAVRGIDDDVLDEYIKERMYDPRLEQDAVEGEVIRLVKDLRKSHRKKFAMASTVHVVSKTDLKIHKSLSVPSPSSAPLPPSSVCVRPTLLSLTANNLTYAQLGTLIHWWEAFPVPSCLPAPYNDPSAYGIVPAWGYAAVLKSSIPSVSTGQLVWGYFPTSTFPTVLQLSPTKTPGHFIEASPHRKNLMNLYQRYMLTSPCVSDCALTSADYDYDKMAYAALLKPVWESMYLLSRFVFSTATTPVDPMPGAHQTWSVHEADLQGTVLISLAAASKTARAFTWELGRRLPDAMPKGLVSVTADPARLLDPASPPFPHKVITYADATSLTTDAFTTSLHPTKVIILDFGGRDNAVSALHSHLLSQNHLPREKIITIAIASEARIYTPETWAEFAATSERVGKVQFNASGVRDAAMELLGEEPYFAGLDKAWREFFDEGGVEGMSLVWGENTEGESGVEGGWEKLVKGEVEGGKGMVFKITGTSGYIGGSVLDALVTAHPEYEISALLRHVPETYTTQFPHVRIVRGDFGAIDVLETEAEAADVVVHIGGSDIPASVTALLTGLSRRPAKNQPIGTFIQTSGTGSVSDVFSTATPGTYTAQIYGDESSLEAIKTLPSNVLHRSTDRLVFAAASDYGNRVRTAIVAPSDIYGRGTGPGKKESFEIPLYVDEALKLGHAFFVGPGENVRSTVHIADLANFYVRLVAEALDPAGNGGVADWGPDGYYMVTSDEFSFLPFARRIGAVLAGLSLLPTPEPREVSPDRVRRMLGGFGNGVVGMYMFAGSSRARAERAPRTLGWVAKGPSWWACLDEGVRTHLEEREKGGREAGEGFKFFEGTKVGRFGAVGGQGEEGK